MAVALETLQRGVAQIHTDDGFQHNISLQWDGSTTTEVFSPGLADRGRPEEASPQVRLMHQRGTECRLAGAHTEEP